MAFGDSFTQGIAEIVLGILRRDNSIDYSNLYPGTVVASDGNRADVEMDDTRLGTLTNCRVLRDDGVTSVPVSGTRARVGWDAKNPSMRFCLTAFDGNGTIDTKSTAADTSITFLTPETIADKDLISEHEIGKSAGTLNVVGASPVVTGAAVSGDDTAFDLTWNIPNGQTLAAGALIATVTLGRSFGSATLHAVATAKSNAWTGAAAFSAQAAGPQTLLIFFTGSAPLVGPLSNLSITVFVRGSK